MRGWRHLAVVTGCVLGLSVLGWGALKAPLPRPQAALDKLPIYFIENRGQLDNRVSYYVQGQGLSVYFTPGGVSFAFTERKPHAARPADVRLLPAGLTDEPKPRRWAMKLDFLGANPVRPEGV